MENTKSKIGRTLFDAADKINEAKSMLLQENMIDAYQEVDMALQQLYSAITTATSMMIDRGGESFARGGSVRGDYDSYSMKPIKKEQFGEGGNVSEAAVFMVEGMLTRGLESEIRAAGGYPEMAGPGFRVDVRGSSNVDDVEEILIESGRRYNKTTTPSMYPKNPRIAGMMEQGELDLED